MSVRGKEKVKNELGFAFMAVNLRKVTAIKNKSMIDDGNNHTKKWFRAIFNAWNHFLYYFELVLSQPLFSSYIIKKETDSFSQDIRHSLIEFLHYLLSYSFTI